MNDIQPAPVPRLHSLRLPFTNLDRAGWARLGLVSLAMMYALTVVWSALYSGVMRHIGGDFGSYMASAQIVRDHGFAAVYDLSLQKEYQSALLYPNDPAARETVLIAPMPYLPPFVAGFLPLLIFGPVASWWLWAGLNALVLLMYVRRLAKAGGTATNVALAFALCLPAYLNLFYDQVNVWLLVFLGEALLAAQRERNLRAGLWLAGLLLKPQTLLLFIPGLILRRERGILTGFALGAAVIGLVSLLLAGVDGMLALLKIIQGFGTGDGMPSNSIEAHMSWRAVAWYLGRWLPTIDWSTVAVGASVITSAVALSLWLVRAEPSSDQYTQIWLGTYAATGLVAWHSHPHMALPMIAPVLLAWGSSRSTSRVLSWWLFGPLVLFIGYHYVAQPVALTFGVSESVLAALRPIMTGMPLLVMNLLVLAYTCHQLIWLPRQQQTVRLSAR